MAGRPLTQKDFKLKALTKSEIAILLFHTLVSLAFWTFYKLDIVTTQDLKGWIHGYYFIVPFVVVGICFRNLRNFKFYLIWIAIAISQIVVYFKVNELPEFFYRGTAFSGLKSLLPTLILFQFFRMFLLRTKGRELIVTIREGRFSMWEEDDNRRMTWVEVLFSLLLMGTIVTFNAL